MNYSEWTISLLKKELDSRKISYVCCPEKSDLVQLLTESDSKINGKDEEEENIVGHSKVDESKPHFSEEYVMSTWTFQLEQCALRSPHLTKLESAPYLKVLRQSFLTSTNMTEENFHTHFLNAVYAISHCEQ